MKLKEITPKKFMCGAAVCPTIFEVEGENKVIIIGSKANLRKLGLSERVGRNEEAIVVDKEMLRQIFGK